MNKTFFVLLGLLLSTNTSFALDTDTSTSPSSRRIFLLETALAQANPKIVATTWASADNKLPVISQTNLYFLSPHADDISLTFGGLIQSEDGFKNKNIRYTTYFGTSNWTANELNLSTDKRVNTITHMRFKEDRDALTELFGGWKNYLYTFHGYHDAPLRDYVGSLTAAGGPGGNFSTFREAEKKLFIEFYNNVKPILAQPDCAAFVLMANGFHIDHFILREAVIKAAHDLKDQAQCQIYFGEDQPYTGANPDAVNAQILEFVDRLGLVPITYPIDVDKKIALFTNNYFSQYEPVYPSAIEARTKLLGDGVRGGERIYLWPIVNYKNSATDPTCTQDFCQLK